LLRAAEHGPLRILIPFVTGLADLDLALSLREEARRELRREGLRFREDVPLGITAEVPAAALTLDALVGRVDFVSVGTNDLVQYLLAADRGDPRVAAAYQPLHPAVLRVLRTVAEAVGPVGLPLCVCGEMAADPLQALLLVGLGFRELSMSASAIPRVRAALRRADSRQLRDVALLCLSLTTAEAIQDRLREELAEVLTPAPATRSDA
jgi:phosphoenolpyruvate-protein kinase (PTS system EI component)